jgi:hypothetical protein
MCYQYSTMRNGEIEDSSTGMNNSDILSLNAGQIAEVKGLC